MDENKRFSGSIGHDYNIVKLIVPYYDEFEGKIGTLLSDYIKSKYADDFTGFIDVYEGGCGTGITTKIILDTDARVRVFAIDNEPDLLNQAREFLKSYSDRVVFIEADLLEALKKVENIDIFITASTIHNLQPKYRQELFEQIGKIIKTGGLYINADKIAKDDEEAHGKDLDTQLGMLKIFSEQGHPELEEPWRLHYLEDERIKFTESEQVNTLEQNGFINIKILFRHLLDVIIIAEKK